MSTQKSRSEIAALRAAALEDLLAATDAELRQEIAEDGLDLDVIALDVKSSMREAAASAMRQRLAQSKRRMQRGPNAQQPLVVRPAIDRIKQIIQDLFQADKSLGLAFRDGKRQTDADWQTLYDDLVAMGAIRPKDTDGV